MLIPVYTFLKRFKGDLFTDYFLERWIHVHVFADLTVLLSRCVFRVSMFR